MKSIVKLSFIISILTFNISCGGKDCNLIDGNFDSYKHAMQVIKSSDFEFFDHVIQVKALGFIVQNIILAMVK